MKKSVELTEREIREIAKCLHLEVEIWKFKRVKNLKEVQRQQT